MCELIYCVYANVHIYIIRTKLFAVFLFFFDFKHILKETEHLTTTPKSKRYRTSPHNT